MGRGRMGWERKGGRRGWKLGVGGEGENEELPFASLTSLHRNKAWWEVLDITLFQAMLVCVCVCEWVCVCVWERVRESVCVCVWCPVSQGEAWACRIWHLYTVCISIVRIPSFLANLQCSWENRPTFCIHFHCRFTYQLFSWFIN